MTATNVSGHSIPPFGDAAFHTTIVAFKEGVEGDEQYEWVVEVSGEGVDCGVSLFRNLTLPPPPPPPPPHYPHPSQFTCGSSNSKLIPILFPNDFVGINLYSKSAPHTETADMNLEEMLKVIEDIGLGWATEEESWAGLDTGFNIVPHAEDCVYV